MANHLQVLSDVHSTIQSDPKVKAPIRHVVIKDLIKVASALKIAIPFPQDVSSGLFMVFEGDPLAAEHCAKGLHAKLLKRLAKLTTSTMVSGPELGRTLASSLIDLDAEVREKQVGGEGCSAAAALVVGNRIGIVLAGSCGGTLWGPGPRALAQGNVGSTGSVIGADGILRKAQAQLTDAQKKAKSLLRMHAPNVDNQLGGSVIAPGGQRPGASMIAARGASAIKAASTASLTGRNATASTLRIEDMLVETIELQPAEHSSLLLGTSGLRRSGLSPQDIGSLFEAAGGDASKASEVLAVLVREKLLESSKGEANWVKQEKAKASEAACIALLFQWESAPAAPSAESENSEPPEKKRRTDAESEN